MSYLDLAKKALEAKNQRKEPENIQTHNALARDELDRFFTQEIMPRLSGLHREGLLPDLAQDPLWAQIEAEWDKASVNSPLPCDTGKVKGLMQAFLSSLKGAEKDRGAGGAV